jgi:hypothetical protein
MADKITGGIVVGTTNFSLSVMLHDSTTNQGKTALAYTDMTGSYYRQGGAARVGITMASLAAVDSAYASGGFKEIDATNMKGWYRFDVPDALFLTGADWVVVSLQATNMLDYGVTLAIITNSVGIRKNTALTDFEFLMIDSADNRSGKTGLTITATRSIDGAAFSACANSASEVSIGIYKIDLAASDLNGDVITFRFTGTDANDTLITVKTST